MTAGWIIVLGLIAAGAGLALAQRRQSQRLVTGRLSFDRVRLAHQVFAIGEFAVTWHPAGGGWLTVTPRDRPERILCSTVPGQAFLAAACGRETVRESRGHFFVRDRWHLLYADQHVERLELEGGSLILVGRLVSRSGRQVAYRLILAEQSPNQLSFQIALSDPAVNRTFLTLACERDERIFGFGMQFSYFDLRGRRLPIFVSEQGIGRGAQPITFLANLIAGAGGAWHTTYAGVPHLVTSRLRSLWLETYEYAVFDLRRSDRLQIQLFAGQMSGRVLLGDSPAELIQGYTACAGRMRPLPDWILNGAVIGLQGGSDRVRQVLRQLDALGTPVAALWLQDWVGQRVTRFGSQLWWNWVLDRDRYPDWDWLRDELAARNIRLMVYINPSLTDAAARPNCRRNLFREAVQAGLLVRDEAGEPYLTQSTDFAAGLIDLTNPVARTWFKQIIQDEVLGIGVSGWMADYAEGLPYDARLCSGAPAATFHNQYPEAWAQLNREVVEEADGGDELVFFTRSGYRHSPRYSTLFWLGDQLVSWDRHDGIKTAVTGLLSSGLSGYSLNHSDVGGFTAISNPLLSYRRSKELLLRWIELNAFTTVFRTHEGNRPEANHQFYSDHESMAHLSRFAKVYCAWGFYRQQLVCEAAATGLPVVRHPFVHYPHDRRVYRLSYQQFLVGNEFMVAPVLDPGRDRLSVYLPAGGWLHLWSGRPYGRRSRGETVTVPAPIGQPAVFYRPGSEVGARFLANLRQAGVMT